MDWNKLSGNPLFTFEKLKPCQECAEDGPSECSKEARMEMVIPAGSLVAGVGTCPLTEESFLIPLPILVSVSPSLRDFLSVSVSTVRRATCTTTSSNSQVTFHEGLNPFR